MRKLVIRILISIYLIALCSLSFSEPLERFEPANIASAKLLGEKLRNSEWIYSWRGRDYKFRFNKNGSIGILESWKNVKWYVSGKSDVVLEGRHSKMLLNFNSDISAFYTRDWDGEKSDGRLVAK